MNTAEDLYPSRGGRSAGIRPRKEPVVWANPETAPPVEWTLVEQYERDGFLVLNNVFTPEEVRCLQDELHRLRHNSLTARRPEVITERNSSEVRSIFKVHQLSPVFGRLARDERLAGLARYLLADDVYLHQSRLNYKPGFRGREFYWHSDFETWHVEDGMPRMRALSMSIALTDNTPHNGPVLMMPGSHKYYVTCEGETPENNYQQSLQQQETGVPNDASLAQLAERGIADTAGPAGSVLIFDCNTMHGSNSNITPLPRSNAFFVFNALSNRVVAPFCNQEPRPEFVASRREIAPIEPAQFTADDFRN